MKRFAARNQLMVPPHRRGQKSAGLDEALVTARREPLGHNRPDGRR